MQDASGNAGLTWLGKLFVAAVVVASAYAAYWLFTRDKAPTARTDGDNPAPTANASSNTSTPAPTGPVTEFGIAFGTEKRGWLEWAVGEFAKTDAGRNIKVNLIPKGSLEGGQAVLAQDKAIHVWSPASSAYRDVVAGGWKDRHGKDVITLEKPLAFTPMVFVMWEERYTAFLSKHPALTFKAIGEALGEKGGWDAIAGRPEWMFFKFAHTHPSKSNSGLMALVLMAYDFHGKHRGLDGRDITSVAFQDWTAQIETSLVRPRGQLEESTDFLVLDMVRKGPSTYDVVFVYENSAIEYLKRAESRYDRFRVVYPKYNIWNDHPYYVLDVPWSTAEQKKAAGAFLDFLLTAPAQQQAMQMHGFRPANPDVLTRSAESPFEKYKDVGISLDAVGIMCEPVPADVIHNLLLSWQQRVK